MDKSPQNEDKKTFLKSGVQLMLLASLCVVVYAAYLAKESVNLPLAGHADMADGYVVDATDKACNGVGAECISEKPSKAPSDETLVSWLQRKGALQQAQPDAATPTVAVAREPAPVPQVIPRVTSRYEGVRAGQTVIESCRGGPELSGDPCYKVPDISLAIDNDGQQGSSSSFDEELKSITGQVLTDSGTGLANVAIVAIAERLKGSAIATDANRLRFHTLTDGLGNFSLEGLPDGEYTVRSSRHGSYRSGRINVKAGTRYADIVVGQNAVYEVNGRVRGEYGEALEGVTVLPNLLGQASVLTDDNGEYNLKLAVAPGVNRASLRFQRPGYREESASVAIPRSATSADLRADAVMQLVEAWTVYGGSVYDESGDPIAGLQVELKPLTEPRSYSAVTDSNGRYEIPFIEAPADYQLTVHGGNNYRDYRETVNLQVDNAESEIYLEGYGFGSVSGQVVNSDGSPVSDFELMYRNEGSLKPNVIVSTDSSGNFSIPEAPAGEFLLASASSPAILVQGLSLKAGRSISLPLVLDWGQHEIRGNVVDADGYPVPASRVVLQWSNEADGVNASVTRRTATDTRGTFVFTNLGPGPHSLQVDAPGYRAVAVDHDVMREGYDLTVSLN